MRAAPNSARGPSPQPVGLDGVIAAESRLSQVLGARGQLVIAGEPVGSLAGRLPWTVVVDRLFALAEGRAASSETASRLEAQLGAARLEAAARLPAAEGALADEDGIAAVRAALPLVLRGSGAVEIIGALHVVAAAWIRRQRGAGPGAPRSGARAASELLRLSTGSERGPEQAALDAYLGAVVDHGLNASTFTARVVASTRADDLSAVVAALGALKGPLHGGAPGPVLDMLDAIGTPERARPWLERELAAGRRIMGMGHRVYRVRDPRAAVLEAALSSLPGGGARLELARAVEAQATALLAERYPERGLRANVEFGTAVLLEALGIPREAFTVVFACSRVAGWLAHAAEQRRTGRLLRPRLAYVGPLPQG